MPRIDSSPSAVPRTVRNFWIELEVCGRRQRVATGPRGKDGGFLLTISVRSDGVVDHDALTVRGYRREGTRDLVVAVEAPGRAAPIYRLRTRR